MKICHISTTFNSRSGAAKRVIAIAKDSISRGHKVVLIVGRDNDIGDGVIPGAEVYVVDTLIKEVSPLMDFKSLFELRRLIKKNSPDIVHTHLAKGGVLGRLSARKGRFSVVHTIHGPTFAPTFPLLKRLLFWFLEFIASWNTDVFIFVGRQLRDYYKSARICRGSRSVVIYTAKRREFLSEEQPGLSGAGIRLRRELGGRGVIRAAVVGRVVRSKNLEEVVDLVAIVRARGIPLMVAIVGEALVASEKAYLEELKNLVYQKGLNDYIKFTGFLSDLHGVYPAFDMVITASRYEGLPNVVVEAVLSGVPVFGYDVFGFGEVFEKAKLTYSMAQGDLIGLANLVADASKDLNRYKAEVARIRSDLVDEFSQNKMVSRTHEIYLDLLRDGVKR